MKIGLLDVMPLRMVGLESFVLDWVRISSEL
jgi:hypothetical protein